MVCNLLYKIAVFFRTKYFFRASRKFELEKMTIGLWHRCESNASEPMCAKLDLTCSQTEGENLSLCHKRMVARAFVTVACIMSALSFLCLFTCAMINTDSNRIIAVISKILPFVSCITGIIGVAVGIAFAISSLNDSKISEA